MPEIKRKPSESFESLLRRFRYKVLRSGRLIQAKKVRFRGKKKSKTMQKQSALRRETIKTLRDGLIKKGKLKEGEKMKLHKMKKG